MVGAKKGKKENSIHLLNSNPGSLWPVPKAPWYLPGHAQIGCNKNSILPLDKDKRPPILQSVNLGHDSFVGPLWLGSLTGIVGVGGSSPFFLWIQQCPVESCWNLCKEVPPVAALVKPVVSPNARKRGGITAWCILWLIYIGKGKEVLLQARSMWGVTYPKEQVPDQKGGRDK